MSEFVTVFVELAIVVAGLALMGAVIWTAQSDGFQPNQSLAPSRTPRPVGGRVPAAARRPSAPATLIRRPVYSGRR
jgi:hypothetical protein